MKWNPEDPYKIDLTSSAVYLIGLNANTRIKNNGCVDYYGEGFMPELYIGNGYMSVWTEREEISGSQKTEEPKE